MDRGTGKLVWEVGDFKQISPIALAGDGLYVGSSDRLVALKRESGERIWECPVRGWSHHAPRIDGGTVYYSTQYRGPRAKGGGLPTLTRHYAVEAATGKILRDQDVAIPERRIDEPGARTTRLYSLEGGFPVLSGEFYDGPRRSAVVCRRGVDIDKE